MKGEQENNRELLIKRWFNRLLNGNQNDEVLLVYSDDNKIREKLNTALKELNPSVEYSVYYTVDVPKYLSKIASDKNIVLITKDYNNIELTFKVQKKFNKSFLYIPLLYNFSSKINYFISKDIMLNEQVINIEENKRYQYYLETVDPYSFIKNFPPLNQKEVLIFLVSNRYDERLLSLLLDKTTYSSNEYIDAVISDLNMFQTNNLLTARLAIVLYRLLNLDLTATTTKIGRYFNQESGSKSKTFNAKNSKVNTLTYDLHKKNFKAYDLSVNESEIAIRREIAKNLLSLNIKGLNISIIASTTKLTEKEVVELTIDKI